MKGKMIHRNSDPEVKRAVVEVLARIFGRDVFLEWWDDEVPWLDAIESRVSLVQSPNAVAFCDYLVGTIVGAEERAILVEDAGGRVFHIDKECVAIGLQFQPNLVRS